MEWDGPGDSGPLSLVKFELAARLQTKNGALWDTNVNEIVWERIQLSLAKYAHSLTTSAFYTDTYALYPQTICSLEHLCRFVAPYGMLSSSLCWLREPCFGSRAYWRAVGAVSRDKRGGNDHRRLGTLNVERALTHGSVGVHGVSEEKPRATRRVT
jgi:hypothetical protein